MRVLTTFERRKEGKKERKKERRKERRKEGKKEGKKERRRRKRDDLLRNAMKNLVIIKNLIINHKVIIINNK
jgi:hypothetical protein